MNSMCQFRPTHSTICENSAEVLVRGGGPENKDLYVCSAHDLFCFKCGKNAIEYCQRVENFRYCRTPQCNDCSHNGEHHQ